MVSVAGKYAKKIAILVATLTLLVAAATVCGLGEGTTPQSDAGQRGVESTPTAVQPVTTDTPSAVQPAKTDNPVATTIPEPTPTPGSLQVQFIDVGQGDSTFITLPDGQTVLVDGGPGGSAPEVLRVLREAGVKRIDHLVATHPHEDHIGGLDDVLRAFEVGAVYMPRKSHNTAAFESLLVAIADEGLKVTTARAGVGITSGEGFSVGFVSPVDDVYKEINDYSAAVKIMFGTTSLLVSGDLTAQSESRLGSEVDVDLLKIAHHGSKGSSTSRFLDLASPKYAVISVGADNSYGHPTAETLAKLAALGVDVYRTDVGGTITVRSDGSTFTFDRAPDGL